MTTTLEERKYEGITLPPSRRATTTEWNNTRQPCPNCGQPVVTSHNRRSRCQICGTLLHAAGARIKYWTPTPHDRMGDHYFHVDDTVNPLPDAASALKKAVKMANPLRRLLTPQQKVIDIILLTMQALEEIIIASGQTVSREAAKLHTPQKMDYDLMIARSADNNRARQAFNILRDIRVTQILDTQARLRSAAQALEGRYDGRYDEEMVPAEEAGPTAPRRERGTAQ